MWLFHFRIGGERESGSRHNAQGIGHAMRCLNILETAAVPSSIVTVDNDQARSFLNSRGMAFYPERMLDELLSSGQYEMIVSDINYLEDQMIGLYRRYSPWTCLAPRGQGKYWADLAFKDVVFDGEPVPAGGSISHIFSGPEYAATGKGFTEARMQLERGDVVKDPRSIVVSMGGMDHFDMTGEALKGLKGLSGDWVVRVIIGPLYEHLPSLIKEAEKLSCSVEILRAPSNLYGIIARSSFGIFGAGLVTYEGIGLGVPCLNMSQSAFHKKRSIELEGLGVGKHVGDSSCINKDKLTDIIIEINNNQQKLEDMRNKGMKLIDGNGILRIINIIKIFMSQKNNCMTKNKMQNVRQKQI